MCGDFMKIVKINSLGCPSCIIMNKVINKIKEEYDVEIEEYDYDFDEEEIVKFNVGKILPVFIFFKDGKEVDVCCLSFEGAPSQATFLRGL